MQVAPGKARTPRRRRRRNAPMSEINVTPFVDVMLVLLIIFMVAAPMLTVGVPMRLPETAANAVAAEPQEPLTVSIPVEGSMMLMTDPVEETQLIARLTEISEARGARKVYLRADGAVPYARVAQVMGALNAAGFNDIVLVTDAGGPRMDG